ncbi:MAG: hypothetical protein ACREHV_14505 [Rhizomicrobium sp.]
MAFDPPMALDSKCYAIDANGWIAGFYRHVDSAGMVGFVRSPRGAFKLFDGKGYSGNTYAWGINTKAAVAGSWSGANGRPHGLGRTDAGKLKTFDPTGSVATYAVGVNSKDAIAGYWQDSSGDYHGFVRVHMYTGR